MITWGMVLVAVILFVVFLIWMYITSYDRGFEEACNRIMKEQPDVKLFIKTKKIYRKKGMKTKWN